MVLQICTYVTYYNASCTILPVYHHINIDTRPNSLSSIVSRIKASGGEILFFSSLPSPPAITTVAITIRSINTNATSTGSSTSKCIKAKEHRLTNILPQHPPVHEIFSPFFFPFPSILLYQAPHAVNISFCRSKDTNNRVTEMIVCTIALFCCT